VVVVFGRVDIHPVLFWSIYLHMPSANTLKHFYISLRDAEALVVATKEIELEVNTDKTKYMVMSRDRNAEWGHGVKTDNRSIERVEELKYLGATLTDQNSIQE
jgi:hypothetical protein